MNRWIPYAFVRIVVFFMIGITLGIFFPDVMHERLAKGIFLNATLIYILVTFAVWRKKSQTEGSNLKFYAGFVGLLATACAGYIQVQTNTESRRPDHIMAIDGSIDFFTATVAEPSIEKENSWKTVVLVDAVKCAGNWKRAHARIMLYLAKRDFPSPFQYGDVLLVKGAPQPVPGPSNPEEFDYRRFLSFKNIYHQKFVRKDDAQKIAFLSPSWIEYYALHTRQWADATIRENVSGEREEGLASALVLGVTEGLDEELLSVYKSTGTLHVLAVSGLHVGIVYGLVLLLLRPLNTWKGGVWIISAISILVLWAYAFVTGLSPSVLRAVTMFSFIALAKPGGHRTNIYNTMAASAFILLWHDPFLVMSVGFQLSYLAVLGIVYMQPGLYNLLNPSNRLLDEIWKVSSVSIAAQIATFSIGLLYFHQFPNYFLLSNLIAIPGSFIVLVLGLATLATSFISPIATALGFLLEWVIKAMNAMMFILQDLPFSLIENVYITPLQCWLLFMLIVGVLLIIRSKSFIWVKIVFALGCLFVGAQWYHYIQQVSIRKLTVYNIRGHTAIDFFENGQAFFLADSLLMDQPQKTDFHIVGNRIKSGVTTVHKYENYVHDEGGTSLMVWNNKSILRIHQASFNLPRRLQVDYVIISNNAVRNLSDLLEQITAQKVILDSSNSTYYATKLIQESEIRAGQVYSVVHDGAFEVTI
jgi:competence protein ComEC